MPCESRIPYVLSKALRIKEKDHKCIGTAQSIREKKPLIRINLLDFLRKDRWVFL